MLTAYDGNAISYDEVGNPISDGTWTYSWRHGRQLESMTSSTATWSYEYNSDGLRISRSDGSVTYEYVYLGDQLVYMTVTDAASSTSVTMKFNYDASGNPTAIVYNGTTYYYLTNLQGDIVGIVNQAGTQIVSYTYGAWGNLLSTSGSHGLI